MDRRSWTRLLVVIVHSYLISAQTNPQDGASLKALTDSWKERPSNWDGSDPCGSGWIGIKCIDSRVVSMTLSSIGLSGTISGDIENLSELQILDLSYNVNLNGNLPTGIGKLIKLTNLILVGCGFSGLIPDLGSLQELVYLSLNSNHFSGGIPPSIGSLSKLYWLDLADNMLTGTIPISSGTTPGLDNLKHTAHFHFGNNQLSGDLPEQLFSADMHLIHVLFDDNQLSGSIPSTLGLVKSLEVVRLDQNSLSGPVPLNINNLTAVGELYLSNNKLTGPIPNLTGMSSLNYLDLSNNTFDTGDAPSWFSELESLTTLVMEYSKISGELPPATFTAPQLQTVKLRNNLLNGTLNISTFSSQLKLVDLQNNNIKYLLGGGETHDETLILKNNPYCEQLGPTALPCTIPPQSVPTYSVNLMQKCAQKVCPPRQNLSPECACAYPYVGSLFFRAIAFSDLQNSSRYSFLETKLVTSLKSKNLPIDSVYLHNITWSSKNYLEIDLQIFPAGATQFNETEISVLGFILSNQTFKPPKYFGPFYFIGVPYNFPQDAMAGSQSKSNSVAIYIGASVGGIIVILLIVCVAVYAYKRGRRSQMVDRKSQHLASWESSKSIDSIPQLKGARFFSFDELKRSTDNFSEANDAGVGGYGKVYKGKLENGQLVAVKRARYDTIQSGVEFKTEIEMLSRVHHKNLVSLIGFCFEKGEQLLVYEYIANGSVKDSLSGTSGVLLDWKKRLRVALGAARGLAYMHELANPPIIHRDIKSSNILLDETLNAKVSDFGLSKPVLDVDKGHVSTQVKGTMGYLDPEYYMSQQLTEKSDVYSFGVMMLELITARKPLERGRYIVREVKTTINNSDDLYGLHELIDPMISASPSIEGFNKFVDLAMKCVEELGINRPMMSEVVKEIETIMQLAGMNPNADSSQVSASYEEGTSGDKRHPYSNEGFQGSAPIPR